MSTYVFAGQGTQYRGMGIELFEKYKEELEAAEHVLHYSIRDLLRYDSNDLLNNTLYTQPILYVVYALSFLDKVKEENVQPDFFIGHSLGEFVALFAAGSYDFLTGLKIVNKRAQLMSMRRNKGAMAAVIGLGSDEISSIIKDCKDTYIANYNLPQQTVISGTEDAIKALKEIFLANGATTYKVLPIDCACHSPILKASAEAFYEYLEGIKIDIPKIPVISNLTGKEYSKTHLRQTMSEQMYKSVMWRQSINYLAKEREQSFIYCNYNKTVQKLVEGNMG